MLQQGITEGGPEFQQLEKDYCEKFLEDEEAENESSQKEDMKEFLSKLNGRIETLVSALKEAECKISKSTDQDTILQEIKERKSRNEGPIAGIFRDKIGYT